MTMNFGQEGTETSERTRRSLGPVASGSFAQAAAAGGAAVLAIIGLAGTLTQYMVSIGTIALGAAFLLHGGSFALRFVRQSDVDVYREPPLGNGITAGTIAGIAGVALGILALLDVAPTALVPAAIIVFSGALFLDSGVTDMAVLSYQQRIERTLAGAQVPTGGGEQLVAIGGAALGILALIGYSTVTLSLVALLAIGVCLSLTGSAFGAKAAQSSR